MDFEERLFYALSPAINTPTYMNLNLLTETMNITVV